ncbi:MAG: ATP-binding cassette domain-containing protein, partial [Anaerolineales bacterium]|nr:ATP-binding cassette domain-containing protein [Anaerolineales bacterium]
AFGTYLAQMYGPLMALTNAQVQFAESMVSFERVFEVLDIEVEISEIKKPIHLPAKTQNIQFENVSFEYQDPNDEKIGLEEVARLSWRGNSAAFLKRGAEKQSDKDLPGTQTFSKRWALDGVSFQINSGELVALVGPSGAGKTTVTYLLPRLYDPTSGRILIDGQDIRNFSLASLANHIGMVTQETYLFYDTIQSNLLYARPEATDQEIIAAAKIANIHEFISELPEGYDTVVGERGYRLSGGERQRIAIARVVLRDPAILVLDEATSSLDSLSEDLIQKAMKTVMKNRTSLVIAHRLSTILAADKILVMDRGKLVQQGTHEQLLQKGGLYRTLYETQFKG